MSKGENAGTRNEQRWTRLETSRVDCCMSVKVRNLAR